jgi:hypothetical protein
LALAQRGILENNQSLLLVGLLLQLCAVLINFGMQLKMFCMEQALGFVLCLSEI